MKRSNDPKVQAAFSRCPEWITEDDGSLATLKSLVDRGEFEKEWTTSSNSDVICASDITSVVDVLSDFTAPRVRVTFVELFRYY
jgi:hypothetical protein